MIRIHLINNVEVSIACRNVDSFVLLVKGQIIRVARDV
jgi:hypothetical protein